MVLSTCDRIAARARSSTEVARSALARVGEVVGGTYRLDELIATGGMGAIYRAVQLDLAGRSARRVAVKMLTSAYAADEEVIARFLREARALDAVRHPNVVAFLDAGLDANGVPFVVQELLEGNDLHAWTMRRGGRATPKAAVAVALPIARALVAAHTAGVVHRDVKPENVFLAKLPDGRVVPKLVDFGISRFVADEVGSTRLTGASPIGTPAYMSPEQVRSTRDVDGRTDVWSLGVVLYELVSGRLPYDGGDAHQMVAAIASSDPRRLEDEIVGEIDPALLSVAAVCDACLVTDRDKRLTAARLVDALERARDEIASGGRVARPSTPLPPPPSSAVFRRRRGARSLAALAASIAAGGAIYWSSSTGRLGPRAEGIAQRAATVVATLGR